MNNRRRVAVAAFISIAILLTGVELVNVCWANFTPPPPELPPIYIRENGSIEPPNAPIQREGDCFIFTGNVTGYCLWVQRSNIVIDGSGYVLQGLPNRTAYIMYGMVLKGVTNVTVENIVFEGLNIGLYVINPSGDAPCSNILITGNVFRDSYYGVSLGYQSFNNTVSKNTFTDLIPYAICLYSTNNNTIIENSIVNNRVPADSLFASTPGVHGLGCGTIAFDASSNNTIKGNNFQNNTRVVELIGDSYGNLFCQNNFIDSSVVLMLPYPPPFDSNRWDNGLMGNYWSDYKGVDSNADGVGDTAFTVDGNNTDYYPLVAPVSIQSSEPSPSPTPASAASPTPNSTPTQQPTSAPSQTPDRVQVQDFAPVLIPAGMSFLALVVVGLLVYFRKRRAV